jgi:integrase
MPPGINGRQMDAPITVSQVTAEFREHVKTKYANNRTHASFYRDLCRQLELECGEIPAAKFGPRRLAEIRDVYVAGGNCRTYVNRQTRGIIAIFRYAVSRELVGPELIVALDTLDPLRYGQTEARESEPVKPVDIETVRLTARHLSPVIKAMIRVQAATGMRPGEVTSIRPIDIEQRSDGVWVYRPPNHKTKHKGKTRAIPLVGDARLALVPFLDRPDEAYCFSPAESMAWHREQRRKARKTPSKYGNRPGTNRKENPRKQPGEKFDKDSYRRAIQRAAKAAGTDHWFPYQLRHTAGSVIREALGVEAAQAVLGHSRAAMTEHYAKQSLEAAIRAAEAGPSVGE